MKPLVYYFPYHFTVSFICGEEFGILCEFEGILFLTTSLQASAVPLGKIGSIRGAVVSSRVARVEE